jgi:hypothetical protein
MVRDMTVRGFSPWTHKAYIAAVVGLARYYRRSPDQISADEVQTYVAHLYQDRHRSWSTCSQAAHAFRFFSTSPWGGPRRLPRPRPASLKAPEILSRAEVCRLLAAPRIPATASCLPPSTLPACG